MVSGQVVCAQALIGGADPLVRGRRPRRPLEFGHPAPPNSSGLVGHASACHPGEARFGRRPVGLSHPCKVLISLLPMNRRYFLMSSIAAIAAVAPSVAVSSPLASSEAPPAGGPRVAVLPVDTDRAKTPIDRRIYGHFLEHINHSVEDGLFAEQIQGSGFEGEDFKTYWESFSDRRQSRDRGHRVPERQEERTPPRRGWPRRDPAGSPVRRRGPRL